MKSPFAITALIFFASALFAPKFLIFLPLVASLGLTFFSMYRKEALRFLALPTLLLGCAVITLLPPFAQHHSDQDIERARAISKQAAQTK